MIFVNKLCSIISDKNFFFLFEKIFKNMFEILVDIFILGVKI